MRYLSLLLILLSCSLSVFGQSWKRIQEPSIMDYAYYYDVASDSKGNTYFIYADYSYPGTFLKVLKYETLEQEWDTIYNQSFTQSSIVSLKTDRKNDEIYISVQLMDYPNHVLKVFSLIDGTVNSVCSGTLSTVDDYEQMPFIVGNGNNEFYWLAKKQYDSKYFISKFDFITSSFITDTIPTEQGMPVGNFGLHLVGDTLWVSYMMNTEPSTFRLLKKHKDFSPFYTYDGSVDGIFKHNGIDIVGYYGLTILSDKSSQLYINGRNTNDEIFAYKFTNGLLSTSSLPPSETFESISYENAFNKIHVASNYYNSVSESNAFSVYSLNQVSNTWDLFSSELSSNYVNDIRLGASSNAHRLVAASKYYDEVSYSSDHSIYVYNDHPNLALVNFTQANICSPQTNIPLSTQFQIQDPNWDSLVIIDIVSSNQLVIPNNSISYSTSSFISNTTSFDLFGSILSAGSTNLQIKLTDGYDTTVYTQNIVVNAAPSAPTTSNQAFCGNKLVSDLAITGTNVQWFNSLPIANPLPVNMGLNSGKYYFTQTVNGCTSIPDSILVTVNPLPTVNAGTDVTICAGQQVTLTGTGASSYSWDNGVSNGMAFTPSATTTYTVTGTDANGCSNTDQVVVTANPLPTVNAGTDVTICAGQQVTLIGTGAASYSWDNGVTNGISFTPSATTTYTVTGTDANGCSNTDQVVVTVNPLPTVNAGTDVTICAGQQVTLTGSGAASYSWDNGVSNGVAFTPSSTTTYTVTGTDANGCSNTDQVVVTVNPLPTVNAGTDVTICAGQQVTLTGTGAASYSWDNGVTNGISFTPSATTTYTVTGTDANGCSNTDQVVVTVNPLPTVNAGVDVTVCAGQQVTLTGSGAASYSWDNGVSNGVAFTPSATTTYTVTGTDANGCSNTDQVVVTANPFPTVNAGTDVTICAGQQVTLTGSGAASYSWDNGVSNGVAFTPSATTTYTVTGTDANGCSNTDQVVVTVNPLPTVNAGTDVTICAGQQVTLTGTGAASYSWDNGVSNGLSFTPSATTTYTVTGTDANGCSNTDQVVVTVNPLPTVNAGVDVTVCAGQQVTLIGTGTGSITWNNAISNGESFIPSESTTYTATVLGINGCTASDDVLVTVLENPIVDVTVTSTICNQTTGTATATIQGGTNPYSYYWSNGTQNQLSIQNLGTGTYYLFVTDANNCQSNGVALIESDAITITPTITPVSCFGGNNGAISIDIQGLPLPYSILWSSGHSSGSISNLVAGTYELTATSQTGCVATGSYVIPQPAPLVTTVTTVSPDCNVSNGSISITGTTGGTPNYSYAWSNGGNGIDQTNLSAAIYSITTTDGNNCQTINTVYLSNAQSPIVLGQTTSPTCEEPIGAIDVTINANTANVDISWSNGATTEDIANLNAGNYVCTATDDDGCKTIKGWNLKNIKPDVQEICLVTVDSFTTTNLVVWEKPQSNIISHYGIYRETSVIGEYLLIDTVHYSNLSVFNDVVASPLVRSWRYKISAFNYCDNESDLSNQHKTLHLNTFDQGGTSTLITWDAYEGTTYGAFDLWRYTDLTGWELVTTVSNTTFSYVDQTPISTEGLDYMVEITPDEICTATFSKAQDFNNSRSNKEKGIFNPGQGDENYSNNGVQETIIEDIVVRLYPNPNQGIFTVYVDADASLTYRIVSLTGSEISSGVLHGQENTLQQDQIQSGMYYLILSNLQGTTCLPFVKNQ